MSRARLRDLGIRIGTLPTGRHNAITDVPGILVGHTTLIYDHPRVARTGITVVVPRGGEIWKDNAFAGFHSFNGTGEMTGMHWLTESGLLCYPIAITNTQQVGTVHESMVAYGREKGLVDPSALPVVAETLIIIIATDAPLLPGQCQRLARRATVGLARTGGLGFSGSGDLFLAFATGNHLPADAQAPVEVLMIPHHHLNPFFEAVAEAVEEAILNALTAAETMVGRNGRTAYAIPLETLHQVISRYRPTSGG
jgi:L-aminopeptidase/D-esterase-like protein